MLLFLVLTDDFSKYSLDLYQAYRAIKPYFNELGLVIRDALSVFCDTHVHWSMLIIGSM